MKQLKYIDSTTGKAGFDEASDLAQMETDITANNAKVSFPEAPADGKQYARKDSAWSEVTGGGGQIMKEFGSADMATLASTSRTYLSSSGREFISHSGTGNSDTYCGMTFTMDKWVSGGKLQVYCTSGSDGAKYFKYYVIVTIWNGTSKTQETLYFTKTLTTAAADYPQLKTNELTLSSGLLAALGNGYTVTFKLGRDAGDGDDDYNSPCYTEILTFKYNY